MFFKNNKINLGIMIVSIFLIPILFILILKMYYYILPGEEIGEIGDWISFSGGYVGAILALFGIWGQIVVQRRKEEAEKKEKNLGLLKYLVFMISKNVNTFENCLEIRDEIKFVKNNVIDCDENKISKNLIDDNLNTLFKYSWSSLFFTTINKLNDFYDKLNIITNRENKKLYNELIEELIVSKDKDIEFSRTNNLCGSTAIELYKIYDCSEMVSYMIYNTKKKDLKKEKENLFLAIDDVYKGFNSSYTAFKCHNDININNYNLELDKEKEMSEFIVEMFLINLFLKSYVINSMVSMPKYLEKFSKLNQVTMAKISCLKLYLQLNEDLKNLRIVIENEYK